jgi:retinol dehydrogenase-12
LLQVVTVVLGKPYIFFLFSLSYCFLSVETCKALAYAGARVILCSRSVKAGEQAVKDEIGQPGLGGYTADTSLITVKALDLNSLQSVKAFADEFNKTESRLDFIVCNAGIMALPSCEYTEAGFERQLGVNHFGHFYLVRLLLPKMLATDDTAGRIVVLSSSAHNMGKIDVNDLHYKNGRSYRAWQAYGQSKLANLLFAKELADRLAESSPNVTAVSVHPGVIQTNLWRFVVTALILFVSHFLYLFSLQTKCLQSCGWWTC